MREKKYVSIYFTKEPYTTNLNLRWETVLNNIHAKYLPIIASLEVKTKQASAKFQETKKDEDWKEFAVYRAKLAGRKSGLKRCMAQQKKIVFITEFLDVNKVDITYTIIQFIAKFLDGSGFDKETALEIREQYKATKDNFHILDEHLESWGLMRKKYYEFIIPQQININAVPKKVNKI